MIASEITLGALAWLLTYAVHSTVLLGLVWLVSSRGYLKSVRVREAFWRTALLGGILSASVQTGFSYEPFGGRFALEPETSAVALEAVHPELSTPLADGAAISELMARDLVASGFETERAATPAASGSLLSKVDPAQFSWTEWALAFWALGGVVLCFVLFLAYRRLRDHLAGRRRVEDGSLPGLLALLRRRSGMLRHVRLTTSPRLSGPIAMGTLFPQICVPERAIHGLSSSMQESMLAHELAHIVRFDPFWLGLCRVLETVLFFQPLNRVARVRLQECAEFSCDDWAVEQTRDRISLARCLAEVANWMIAPERPLPACGMTQLQSPLGERIERILEARASSEEASRWLVPGGALLLSTTILLVPGFSSTAPAAELPEPAEFELELADTTEVPEPLAGGVNLEDTTNVPLMLAKEFAAELENLDSEMLRIRKEMSERDVPDAMHQRLSEIDERVRSLRQRMQRVDELLSRMNHAAEGR